MVHVQTTSGGFGRRFVGTSDYVVEACEIAKAARAAGLNVPVRLLWSREDDIKGGYYRPMYLHRARIGFDERGQGCTIRRSAYRCCDGVASAPLALPS
jgi:isoquinoline 1-oxidoreductase beta subunit